MSAAVSRSYGTPLGLIATTPLERSMPLALPQVSVASPCAGRARLAARTSARSCSSNSDLRVLEVEQFGQPAPASCVVAEVQHEVVWAAVGEPLVHEGLHALLRAEMEVVHLDFRELGSV